MFDRSSKMKKPAVVVPQAKPEPPKIVTPAKPEPPKPAPPVELKKSDVVEIPAPVKIPEPVNANQPTTKIPAYILPSGYVEIAAFDHVVSSDSRIAIRGKFVKPHGNAPTGTTAAVFDVDDSVQLLNGNYVVHIEDIAAYEVSS